MNEDYEIEQDGSNEEFEIEQVLRPKLFVDFEGQDKIVDNLKVFIEAAKKVTPALASNDLGIPSYTKDIDMAKKALGVKELKSELFPGARATGEFISGMAEDVARKVMVS